MTLPPKVKRLLDFWLPLELPHYYDCAPQLQYRIAWNELRNQELIQNNWTWRRGVDLVTGEFGSALY